MISKREWLLLYWAEGEKSLKNNTKKVGMSSTDPLLLKLFIYGLVKFYNIPMSKLRGRLILWTGIDEAEAKRWWENKLRINLKFIKTYWRKPGKKQGKHKYGTLRVYVNSKDLLIQILQDLENLKNELLLKI